MKKLRILYIEDQIGDRMLFEHSLLRTDLNIKAIDFAENIDSLVNKLKVHTYDVVFLSLEFDKQQGLEVLKKFKSELEESCKIAVSSGLTKDLHKEATLLGVQDCVFKHNLESNNLENSILWSLERHQQLSNKTSIHQSILEKEERFQVFSEKPLVYILRTDLQGNYTYYNDIFAKTFLHGDKDVIGQLSLHHIIDDDHKRTFETVEKCLRNPGQIFSVHLRKPGYLPGTIVKTTWEFVALCDSLGEPIEIQCTGYDLSAKIKAHLAVQDSLRYQKMLLDSEQELFFVGDRKGIIQFASGGKAIFKTKNSKDLLEKDIRNLISFKDRLEWDFMRALPDFSQKNLRLEFQIESENSAVCDCTYRKLPDDNFTLIARLGRNEQKEIEDLKSDQKFLSDALRNLPLALLIIEQATGEIIAVNKAFTKMFSFKEEELVHRFLSELDLWSKDDEKAYSNKLLESARVDDFKSQIKVSDTQSVPISWYGNLSSLNKKFCELRIFVPNLNSKEIETNLAIFNALVQKSTRISIIMDSEGLIIFCSDNIDILEHKAADIIGKNISQFLGLDDVDRIAGYIKRDNGFESSKQLEMMRLKIRKKAKAFMLAEFSLHYEQQNEYYLLEAPISSLVAIEEF